MNTPYQNNIAQYLIRRMQDNANWYHETGRIDDFVFNTADETIFFLIHFVISQLLHDGHTVLLLNRHDDINNTQNTAHDKLSPWQLSVLHPIVSLISDKVGDELDFNAIFGRIDELSNDKTALAHYVHHTQHDLKERYYQHSIITKSHSHQSDEQVVTQLGELMICALRFYYVTSITLGRDFDEFIKRLYANPFFAHGDDEKPDRAVVFYHDDDTLYLWLGRSYQAERELLSAIHEIRHSPIHALDLPINPSLNPEQQQAIRQVASEPFSIITGGPGTGKTFTVAQIVLALHHALSDVGGELSLALVAPTGKASQRMAESLQNALSGSQTNITLPEPMTIHRLLGIGMSGMPRYHASNPLPYELIVVDEASMLGTELARHLLCAVKRGARIILLGDAHQLSAVDAGAVLADLCRIPSLMTTRTHLVVSNRFSKDSGIGRLAQLINQPENIAFDKLIALIHQESYLSWMDIAFLTAQPSLLRQQFYKNIADEYMTPDGFFALTKTLKKQFATYGDDEKQTQLQELNKRFNQYRILTASHIGSCGDELINGFIESLHREYLKLPTVKSPWYHGRPVMILKNRYDLGLFNGDIGICLQSGKRGHELSVYFGDSVKGLPINMLDGDIATTGYAMTVHKSQGSEFEKVAVVFNDDNERLLSKELIYTAITRAKTKVAIYSTEQALLKAVNTPTIRQTGLLVHDDIKSGVN
ncbi:exodeoxyribonuclease V subunit alpha [Moraxella bovis]|uniref:RecBCD enzyme subunit RecD n=1 Tax=Moraxella bovis TaxID=476 RepID=A0A378PZT4_MORBO|nr:exodeoxyribonuclease V subunit alpha [Moraxella bovis]STY93674.1 Exodeoxyribonuclease V alpha chain [Moraxella bovis]